MLAKQIVILTGAPTGIAVLVLDVTEPLMLNSIALVGHNDPDMVLEDEYVVVVPLAHVTVPPDGTKLASLPLPPVAAKVQPPMKPFNVL